MLRVKVNFICNYTIMYDMQEIVLQFACIFAYFMISHLHFPCSIHPDLLHSPKICQIYLNSRIYHRYIFSSLQSLLFLSYLYTLFHFKCHFHKKKSVFNKNPARSLVHAFNETCKKNSFTVVISKIFFCHFYVSR